MSHRPGVKTYLPILTATAGTAFLLLIHAPASWADIEAERESLRGLTGLHVLVEDLRESLPDREVDAAPRTGADGDARRAHHQGGNEQDAEKPDDSNRLHRAIRMYHDVAGIAFPFRAAVRHAPESVGKLGYPDCRRAREERWRCP